MTLTTRVVVSCIGRMIALIGTACYVVIASAAPVGEAEVKQCVQEIFQRAAGGQCSKGFSLESVRKVDAREAASEANVIADIEFRVKQQVGGTSQAATECTGNAWQVEVKNPYPPNTGQWFMYQSQADMSGGYLEPGRGLRVRKTFKFEKWESGWRCAEQSMRPLMLVWDNVTVTPPQQSQGTSMAQRAMVCQNEAKLKNLANLEKENFIAECYKSSGVVIRKP